MATDNMSMRTAIDEALKEGYFSVHYQPQFNNTANLIGAEALIRLEHPRYGMISPGDFIPFSEKSNQIIKIGNFVIKKVFEDVKKWKDLPYLSNLKIAINISIKQLESKAFLGTLLDTLAETPIDINGIHFEVTETAETCKPKIVQSTMHMLGRYGFKLGCDDFGIGNSNLISIASLPFDFIKIDQLFVKNMLTNLNYRLIVQMAIDLGKKLGRDVYAEGVETKEQKQFLASIGCNKYQGFLFSKPLTKIAFEEYAKCSNMM